MSALRLDASPHNSEAIVNSGDADHVESLAADHVRQPAAYRQHDGVGDQIGRDDPGAFVDADGQTAGDITQRDVGDRGVEYDHEGGDGEHDGDQPGTAIARRRAAFAAGGLTLIAHFVVTVGTTDMPGPNSTSGRSLNTILTGTR